MRIQTAVAMPRQCNCRILLGTVLLMTWLLPIQSRADAEPTESAQNLTRMWNEVQATIAGWQDEKKGPTWKQFYYNNPEHSDELLMPKTLQAVLEMSRWFDPAGNVTADGVKSAAEENKDDPGVKSILAAAHKTYDGAAAKLNDAFNNVITEAEKDDSLYRDELAQIKVDALKRDADAWFENTPYHDKNMARAAKLKEKWALMLSKGETDREDALKKMTADAATAWPAIAASIKAQEGFTPDKLDAFKGKIIHIKGYNTLGSAYNPGDYDYSHDINGMPVAGKFTPAVSDAVNKATKQTGHDLPGADWDVYAVVEGPGQISRRTHSNGTVKVDGQDVGTVTAEGHQSMPCAVVRIFALHAGPVAVGSSAEGAVTGSAAPAPAALNPPLAPAGTGFSFFKLLEHLLELGLCIAAAGLVVIKSRAVPAVQTAGTSAVVPVTGSDNIALAGLAIAALGVLWLVAKLIIGDLLPALSLTLSGIYLASDWLRSRNVLPQNLAEAIKPLAMPIAGATALFGLLHLFLANWYLF